MINLKDPIYYINRELSWLQFNTRVLQEAQNSSHPPLERLKFLAIYGTNLDEFYMIRVAGLKKLFQAGIAESGADHLTPKDQLDEIHKYLKKEMKEVQRCFNDVRKVLESENITIKESELLSSAQKKKVNEYFYNNLYPVIIPIAVDSTHPFPRLNNLSFGLVVKLSETQDDQAFHYGMVRIPRALPRFIEIESGIYIPIESIVARHINDLFPHYKLVDSTTFRVTRNADIAIQEEEADDFMEILQEGLRLRKKGEMVRLELGSNAKGDLLKFINRHINVAEEDIYQHDMLLNMGSFWQIVGNKNFAHLLIPPYNPKHLAPFDSNDNIFDILDKQDALMYHPYESFDPVVRLIQTAASDPDVVAIRMTLYRSGSNSPIVKALMEAAESGKQVTAMVELKARFDEENNLIWAKALESAGAHVIYGVKGLKVHAKATLVIKQVKNGLKQYAHLGTGNYNPSTARIYTDVSYMTSNEEIAKDLTKFFHFLTGFSKHGKLDTLYMSPTQIKPKLLSLIQNETKAKSGGHIMIKVNSLIDEDIIRALYRASQAGVTIDLIIRGICGLRPGIKGVSENIRVISIIGKYLEHARIFYFKNSSPQIFISSADWMPRNLTRRVELMTPIFDNPLAEKVLQILKLQISDNSLTHQLNETGSYSKITQNKGAVINNHKLLESHANKMQNSLKKDASNYIQQLANRLFKES